MEQGTIKTLNEKGFGFIVCEGQPKDVFFHSDECKNVAFNDLKVGEKVTFEVVADTRGPKALNVNVQR